MLKKIIFIAFYILLFGCVKESKKVAPDSKLKKYLDLSNSDSISLDERRIYIEKIKEIVFSRDNDSLNRSNYFKLANRYFNINDVDNYGKISRKILAISTNNRDSVNIAKSYIYLADFYNKTSQPDSSYKSYFEAEKIYKATGNLSILPEIHLNKAIIQHNNSDFIGSEQSAINALKYLRNLKNDELNYEAYNILGVIYNDLNDFKKSIEYHQRALKFAETNILLKNDNYVAVTLNNIGVVYQNSNDHETALEYFLKAYKDKTLKEKKVILYAMLKDNIAYSNLNLQNFVNLPKDFNDALQIRENLNITPGIIINKLHLSEYYALKKNLGLSIKFAQDAYNLAKSNNLARDQMNSLKQLASVDNLNLKLYTDEYLSISDSLQLAERKNTNKFARIEYETEELTLEKDKLVEQRKTLIYIGLAIILVAVLVFVIRFQAAKNRELLFVQEQQKANEEIYQLMLNQQNKIEEVRQLEKKRIAQELHDGILGKLFGTRMNLGVLNNRNDENANNDRVIFIDELQTLEQEIREISHDLSSEKTAVFNNFVIMVTSFIETQKTICKAAVTFSVDPLIEWNSVDNLAKINLYRILQEAFQNINKYANAKNVSVQFKKADEEIQLSIHDDGAGFVYTKKKKGIGLINMNSRITSLRGSMEIETQPGNGTQLKFRLPLV